MGYAFAIIAGLFVTCLGYGAGAAPNSLVIPQVPSDAQHVGDGSDPLVDPNVAGGTTDYQAEVLSDPRISESARANAVLNENGFDGNTAVIVQGGKANKSLIRQSGKNNSARQTQTGEKNDLRVEQNGDNNRSEEKQTGKNNHKVKIQNGIKEEETIDEDVPQEE